MKNGGELVALSIAILWVAFFFRIIWINYKTIQYVKNYHKNFWENNFQLFRGVGKGGPNVFQLLKGLNDPQISIFKKELSTALKQFLIIVVVSACLVAGYICMLNK